MTAQISDNFLYRGEGYAVAGLSGGPLFGPGQFGLTPTHPSTACWRGYQAMYRLDGPRLVLDSLYICLVKPGTDYEREAGPVINGVSPHDGGAELSAIDDDHERALFRFRHTRTWFNNNYVGLRHRLDYTGGILLADGFISELYVHMGFHPAWKFEKVVELVFEGGELRLEQDRSRAMAELRRMYLEAPTPLEPGPRATDEDIRKYVERAFDQSY